MTAPPDWVAQGIAWRNSLTPATAVSPAESNTKPRVFNISVSSPADAARQLNRIWNSRKLLDDARQSPVQADAIDAPFDLPVRKEADAESDPNAKANLSEKREDRPTGTEATVPSAPGTVPQAPAPTSPPATSAPTTTPSTPTTSPLQELGILPGGTNPVAVPDYPEIDPKSSVPLVVAMVLPEGSSIQQTSSSANGIRITETTASVPGLAPITTTKITDDSAIEAVVECAVPVPLAEPGVVPRAITNPETIFRTGSGYSQQQLEEDLRAFDAGRVVWAGPGRPADYDVAQARLTAAMYTPGEQFNDLVWAQHQPRNQTELEERFAAVQRLNQAGIPWLDPTITAWVADQQKIPVAASPYSTVDNTRPPMYSPAELRQQALEASRTALTANDLKQGVNDFLVASTVGPAIILWDAAHDRGDYSGAEIAWAATELGINTALLIPGLGTLTGAAAKAGIRRIAPKMWEAMSSADNAVDAARIGRAAQERQLTDAVDNYRQRPVAGAAPPSTTSPSLAPRLDDPVATVRAPRTSGAPGSPPTRPLPAEAQYTRFPDRTGQTSLLDATRPASTPPFSTRQNSPNLYPAAANTSGQTTHTASILSNQSQLTFGPPRNGWVQRQGGTLGPRGSAAGPARASGPPQTQTPAHSLPGNGASAAAPLNSSGNTPLRLPIIPFAGNRPGFTMFHVSDVLAKYSPKIKPIDGVFDVGVHGHTHSVGLQIQDGAAYLSQNHRLFNHREISKLIRLKGWIPGQPIRLISCSTGKEAKGFAQNLSNKLGVRVLAPTDVLWVYPSGATRVAPFASDGVSMNSKIAGKFKWFYPHGSTQTTK
ncbi:hypothetical protein [Nocardia sp. A7]|uniref:hypothetical protein n=1 Tax=Nocardia sp. A7 TaxID=2789274 RepID=UPI00397CB58F